MALKRTLSLIILLVFLLVPSLVMGGCVEASYRGDRISFDDDDDGGEGYEHRGETTYEDGYEDHDAEVVSNPELPVYRPKEFRKERGFSTGTGFFVTDNGVMLTNYHVIEDSKQVSVIDTVTGAQYREEVLATDSVNDVAVIKVNIQSSRIPLAAFFDTPKGDEVLTLGYPLVALQGQEQKATFGRINSLSGIRNDIRMVQVDVPVQPGNSGGPLLNTKGEVVGVITATLDHIVASRVSGSLPQNVNFSVKIDYILPVLRKALNDNIPMSDVNTNFMNMPQIVALRESSVMLVVAEVEYKESRPSDDDDDGGKGYDRREEETYEYGYEDAEVEYKGSRPYDDDDTHVEYDDDGEIKFSDD